MANETKLLMQLQFRRDNKFVESFILAAGEPGFEISTNTLKIGDGTKTWAQLPFANEQEIRDLIQAIDDKVNALDDTYATDEEVRVIKEALEDSIESINGVLSNYGDIVTHNVSEFATAAQGTTADNTAATIANYGDIVTHNVAEFATAEQGAKADAAAVKKDVDAALAERYTKTEANNTFETIVTVSELRSEFDAFVDEGGTFDTVVSRIDGDIQGVDGKVDGVDERLSTVEEQLANVSNVMDFVGAGETLPSAEESHDGDVFVVIEGDNAGKEYVFNNGSWIEFGFATANETAIANLQTRMDAVEDDTEDHETRLGAIEPKVVGWDTTKSTVDSNRSTWDKAGTAVQSSDFENFKSENTKAIGDAQESAEKVATDLNTAMNARVVKLESNEAGYATKAYVDGLDHEDTTYKVAATTNALEFTVTPTGKGEAQTVTLVAPVVDTGVMSIEAGNDIVVTPGENGKVTVAHEEFTTGEYTRDPATSSKTGDQYFFTGVTVDNGHVTGANVKSLASVLEGMTFILDGGTSGAEA